jgi:hypothetical protein
LHNHGDGAFLAPGISASVDLVIIPLIKIAEFDITLPHWEITPGWVPDA